MTPKQRDTFDAAAKPLMDWLATNTHPHASVIVTSEAAELVEGVRCYRRPATGEAPRFVGTQENRKVFVIKALREITGCYLKSAKESAESRWLLSECPITDCAGRPWNMTFHRAALEAAGAIIR